MHIQISVEEREVEQLRAQLLHALEQIDYLKQRQDVRMQESLEQALRNNQLLVATIGDLRDELKAAKDALLTQGKVAEEKLIRENEQLHEQLRAAWLSQQTLTKVRVPGNSVCRILANTLSHRSEHGCVSGDVFALKH